MCIFAAPGKEMSSNSSNYRNNDMETKMQEQYNCNYLCDWDYVKETTVWTYDSMALPLAQKNGAHFVAAVLANQLQHTVCT